MTHLAEWLHILKDFPPVQTKAWEVAIHVDLKEEGLHQEAGWNSDEGIVVRAYYRSEDIKDLEPAICAGRDGHKQEKRICASQLQCLLKQP